MGGQKEGEVRGSLPHLLLCLQGLLLFAGLAPPCSGSSFPWWTLSPPHCPSSPTGTRGWKGSATGDGSELGEGGYQAVLGTAGT